MKLLLTTLHAKYVHASLALPSLAAASGIDGVSTVIVELTVNEPHDQALRRVVAERAEVLAFSCYIWNIGQTLRLMADLKQILPNTFIIVGGPEVSYGGFELLDQHPAVDCIVRGEGEETFREIVAALSRIERGKDPARLLEEIPGLVLRVGDELVATPERHPVADLDTLPSPFDAGLVDLGKPLVYYETSRGCPFSCAFCMSSLEKGVRSYSMERIESDLKLLMERAVQTVKLVDRTFNFDAGRANAVWQYILRNNRDSRFHFEIAADLLTDENLRLLEQVPRGMFRFEIGVQSGEAETLARVARKSDLDRLFANVRRLVRYTGVIIHLDLVAGLPHEDYGGFLRSLQSLLDTDAQHIQVEPLKVLKGSPMRRIAREEGYAFSEAPPYKILRTPWLSFADIGRIEEVSRLLDLVHNSGRFGATLRSLERYAPLAQIFSRLAQFREHEGIEGPLSREALFELVWRFALTLPADDRTEEVREALCYDYCAADYPAGRPPVFFTGCCAPAGWAKGEMEEVAQRLGIDKGSRIRGYERTFGRDYRKFPWQEGEVRLRFVYVSAPGKGLRIEVLEKQQE